MPHSPGPWTLVEKEDVYWIIDANSQIVQLVMKAGSVTARDRKEGEVISNAKLIAAAPELLKLCHDALLAITHFNDEDLMIQELNAVIAKATE